MKLKEIRKVNILGVPIDSLNMQETVDVVNEVIKEKKSIQHVAVNAYTLVSAQKDKELKEAIVLSDLVSADGQSVVWASKFLSTPLPQRVPAPDLMSNLIELAAKEKYKIFLLGTTQEIVNRLAEQYIQDYGEDIIGGFRNGYFDVDDEEAIVNTIAQSNSSMLFVAISSPKKELFLNKYKDRLNVPFVMGVGGAFDVLTGKIKRAPMWMQKLGLEWLYRFLQEPRRMWKRYLLGNILFICYVIKQKIYGLNI